MQIIYNPSSAVSILFRRLNPCPENVGSLGKFRLWTGYQPVDRLNVVAGILRTAALVFGRD